MSDEDILKTVADELRRFGDFDNIDYLMPNLGQAIENILAKYDRALSDLVKSEKEKNEIKEMLKKKKSELKAINFDTADDRDYIIRILDELIGEEK